MASLDRADIIAKIRKCLALGSKGANTTEAEMATALGMAKQLMAKFNVTEAEALAANPDKAHMDMADQVAPTRQNPHKYEQYLAMVCSYLFSVKPVLTGHYDEAKGKYRRVIKFYGTQTDVMVAAAAYEILRNTINEMAMNCGYIEAERDQWRVGVVVTLLRKSKEMADGLNAKEAEQCRSLVITKNQLIEQYVAEKVGELKKSRSQEPRVTGAYLKGKQDGNKINLNFKEGVTKDAKQLN